MANNNISVKGSETLIINDYTFVNVASGTYINVEFNGDVSTRTPLGNGGVIVARNFEGLQANVTIKVTAGSVDDEQLLTFYNNEKNNFADTPFLNGSYNLLTIDSTGRARQTKYILSGGCILTLPNISASADGTTDGMERTWVLGFTTDLQNQ